MEKVKTVIDAASDTLWNSPEVFPVMVMMLLGTGIFLTIKLRFLQVKKVWHSVLVIMGKFDDPNDPGDVNHFQALTAALSATIGIGNIAGVATAIHYGGPGSLFWMWVTGLVGMAGKFTECTLGHKYRTVHKDGSVSGGPMYYIEKGLGSKWKWVAVLFAVCTVISSFGSGNGVQAFTMADSFKTDFGIPPWISGLVSAALVGAVIIGGIRRIGAVTSRLVPIMSVLYVGSAMLVLILNFDKVPAAILTILNDAFTPSAQVGGFAGSTFMFTLAWGVKRGLFSNEAGQGSAPIAHAAAKTDESVREGAVALIGPLLDTLIICTMTGLVIVVMGTWNGKFQDRVNLSSRSDVTLISGVAGVQEKGVLRDGDKVEGEVLVDHGRVVGASLVRNHSVVDDLGLSYEGAPFAGKILAKQGRVEKVFSASGEEISPVDIEVAGAMALNGSPLTAMSFRLGLAPIVPRGNLLITIAVFLFAISTAISWSYYGDRAVEYVFGARYVMPYRMVFVAVHFLGAIFSLEVVWGFADVTLGIMAIPNLIAMVLLSGIVKRDSNDYFKRMGYKGL